MATTYEAIATVTVGSGGAANIEFTSIPGTFTDILLHISGRSSVNAAGAGWLATLRPNDLTTNQTGRIIYANGASALSSSETAIYFYVNPSDYTASTFGSSFIYIPNYASSNNKSISVDSTTENNATTSYLILGAYLWSSSSAITSLKLYPISGTFVQYSTATLYGIKNS